MNIAIEYILRGTKINRLITYPCSLFLENTTKEGESKLIIVLHLAGLDQLTVQRYTPLKLPQGDLPQYTEEVVPIKEVFTHPSIIVPNYRMLEFREEPYCTPDKHTSDMPNCVLQERDYQEARAFFFRPKKMANVREDWLWVIFNVVQIPVDLQYQHPQPTLQRAQVQKYYPEYWSKWELWKRVLLDSKGPATELIFAKAYQSQFLKPELFTEPRYVFS